MVEILARSVSARFVLFLLLAAHVICSDFASAFANDTDEPLLGALQESSKVLPEDDEEGILDPSSTSLEDNSDVKSSPSENLTELQSTLSSSDIPNPPLNSSEANSTESTAASEKATPTPSLTVSLTETIIEATPTITDSLTITPTLIEIPDNMYTRAEECIMPNVQLCREKFCTCMYYGKKPNFTMKQWGLDDCGEIKNINCHYLLFCVKERVACLRKLSVSINSGVASNKVTYSTENNLVSSLAPKKNGSKYSTYSRQNSTPYEDTSDDTCQGLKDIYDNISLISSNVNYYDTLLYRECIDYMSYIIKNTVGSACVPALVSMYVCGPSFAVASKLPDPIAYKSLEKGERRLLLTIKARFVGRFDNMEQDASRDLSKHSSFLDLLSDRMHLCFKDAIGIDGEFEMTTAEHSLLVCYGVGVRESDAWVGDEVTVNALNLMLRNTLWLQRSQEALNHLGGEKRTLHPPIVVYEVTFEPGKAAVTGEVCQAECIAAIVIVISVGALAFVTSLVLFYQQSRSYRDAETVFVTED